MKLFVFWKSHNGSHLFALFLFLPVLCLLHLLEGKAQVSHLLLGVEPPTLPRMHLFLTIKVWLIQVGKAGRKGRKREEYSELFSDSEFRGIMGAIFHGFN